MSDVQLTRYNNIVTFAKDWRKYKLVNKTLDANAFRTAIQTDEYVMLECQDTRKNRTVYIYLFDKSSKYSNSSQDLKRLLKKIKDPCDVILITYAPFNVYGRKAIALHKHLNIYTYLHVIFDLVVPNGPLCYPHRILSKDEVLKLCNDELFCYLTNLPKIFDEDSQCIWIGAESGDVVEIKMLSDIAGETIQYRVVVPRSGRVIFAKEDQQDQQDEQNQATLDTSQEDDELEEHRELNTADELIADDVSDAEDTKEDHPDNHDE
jgi:DNA-directed RNA polymerase subunit H (RpoH/RPB5)